MRTNNPAVFLEWVQKFGQFYTINHDLPLSADVNYRADITDNLGRIKCVYGSIQTTQDIPMMFNPAVLNGLLGTFLRHQMQQPDLEDIRVVACMGRDTLRPEAMESFLAGDLVAIMLHNVAMFHDGKIKTLHNQEKFYYRHPQMAKLSKYLQSAMRDGDGVRGGVDELVKKFPMCFETKAPARDFKPQQKVKVVRPTFADKMCEAVNNYISEYELHVQLQEDDGQSKVCTRKRYEFDRLTIRIVGQSGENGQSYVEVSGHGILPERRVSQKAALDLIHRTFNKWLLTIGSTLTRPLTENRMEEFLNSFKAKFSVVIEGESGMPWRCAGIDKPLAVEAKANECRVFIVRHDKGFNVFIYGSDKHSHFLFDIRNVEQMHGLYVTVNEFLNTL